MLVAGIVVAVAGLALAANVGHVADGLASVNRALPWWMKSPVANSALAQRALGGAFVVLGGAFVWLALTGQPG